MSVTLSLRVSEGTNVHSGRLFHREWAGRPLQEGFWPLAVCYNADEDEWYAHMTVSRVFLHADGSEYVELLGFHLDPTEQVEGWLRTPKMPRAWWTDRGGDLVAKLLASGWTEQ